MLEPAATTLYLNANGADARACATSGRRRIGTYADRKRNRRRTNVYQVSHSPVYGNYIEKLFSLRAGVPDCRSGAHMPRMPPAPAAGIEIGRNSECPGKATGKAGLPG